MPNPKKTTRRTRVHRERRTTSAAHRTWRFEQLESRAMLSANTVPMFFGPDFHSMDMHGDGESQAPEAGIFAPEIFAMRMDDQPGWDGRTGDPMLGGRRDDIDRIQQQLGAGRTKPDDESQTQSYYALSLSTSGNNKSTSTTTTLSTGPNAWNDLYNESAGMPAFHAVKVQPQSPPPFPTLGNEAQRYDTSNDPVATAVRDAFSREYGTAGKELAGPPLPYTGVVAATVSTQSVMHGTEASSLLSTGAVDTAPQSYTSQLLLVSGNASSQPVVSTAKDPSLSTAGDTDDFVPLSDFRASADQDSKADALSRQETAVEEVLKSLQDDDSLPSDSPELATSHDGSQGNDQNAQVADYIFGVAYDVAVANGGMMLLQTNGDANESPVNLARVAESHPDMFSPHVGVEASVGFYQAVDRGIEELSATNNTPTTSPAATPAPAKPERRYSSNAGGSSRKAAGVLAASTLAGGLLWVAGRKQSDARDTESRAKRRPAI